MKESKDIFFRSSSSGNIMTDGKGEVITDKQLEELEKLQARNLNASKEKEKPLTIAMKEKMEELQDKKDKPFELSDTAKKTVDDVWLWNEKGYYKQIKSSYIDKGVFGEEMGLSLLTEVDGRFYKKNTERIYKDNRTGECDNIFTLDGKKIIQDVKCCWDTKTFKNADFSKLYEWQGRDYMDLYDADEFWLRYCLVDCPPHLVTREKERKWREFFDNSMSDEEAQLLSEKVEPLLNQIEKNLVYSTNELYNSEERVKTFKITRDDLIHDKYKERIPYLLEYYKTIKLNN